MTVESRVLWTAVVSAMPPQWSHGHMTVESLVMAGVARVERTPQWSHGHMTVERPAGSPLDPGPCRTAMEPRPYDRGKMPSMIFWIRWTPPQWSHGHMTVESVLALGGLLWHH